MVYKWKESRLKADAQKVGAELETLNEDQQGLTPAAILDKARDPDTELHKCFEWDDTEAAEQYRLVQARFLVRNLVITKEDRDEVRIELQIRAYESVKVENHNRYVPTIQALNDPDTRREIIHTLMNDISELQRKLQLYKDIVRGNIEIETSLRKMIG